jgi:hypothetical protein
VEQSLERIRRVKATVLPARPDIDPDLVAERIGTPEHQAVAAAVQDTAA